MAAAAITTQKSRVISRATFVQAGILIGLAAIYAALSTQMYADTLSDAAYSASYWFGTLLQVLCAVIVISIAFKIGLDQGVGRQWLLMGIGVAAYAVGDIVWTVIELHMGLNPYPSLADPFYVLQYGFFLAAIVLAIRSYGHLTPVRTPIVISAVVGVILSGVVYAALLGPYIFPAGVAEIGLWGFILSTFYPLADVLLMLAPVLALALVIRQLGAGRLGWPWWIIVLGTAIFAVTDTVYAYADWSGSGMTATLEMGWLVAHVVVAIAALVARDVYRVR